MAPMVLGRDFLRCALLDSHFFFLDRTVESTDDMVMNVTRLEQVTDQYLEPAEPWLVLISRVLAKSSKRWPVAMDLLLSDGK
jgi:hypothetical protein